MDTNARGLGQSRTRHAGVLRVRVEPGADSSAAEGHLRELVNGCLRPANRLLDLAGIALELLAKTYRCRILEMSPSRLHDGPKLFALGLESLLEHAQGRDQLIGDGDRAGDLDGCRD